MKKTLSSMFLILFCLLSGSGLKAQINSLYTGNWVGVDSKGNTVQLTFLPDGWKCIYKTSSGTGGEPKIVGYRTYKSKDGKEDSNKNDNTQIYNIKFYTEDAINGIPCYPASLNGGVSAPVQQTYNGTIQLDDKLSKMTLSVDFSVLPCTFSSADHVLSPLILTKQ